jgi:hypothetical protein
MSAGLIATESLDPDGDDEQICKLTFGVSLGWEVSRSLELAIFHTFAAPGISELLDSTGEFARCGQKRYDDTVALLREIARDGPRSPAGRGAIRRMNRIHRPFGIGNDDLRYVLATFVVVPVRWIRRYGWRRLTETEVRACVNYYREVGRLMGIRQIPPSYAEFASYLDTYEREHHRFSAANKRLAMALIRVFEAWFPRPVQPLARRCIVAGLGQPLRRSLGLAEPPVVVRWSVHLGLRARAVLLRLIPPLRAGTRNPRRLRTYPDGYTAADLGPASPGSDVAGRPGAASGGSGI